MLVGAASAGGGGREQCQHHGGEGGAGHAVHRTKRGQAHPLSNRVVAKPFLKWAGGKGRLAPLIRERAPQFTRYHEPFLGAGAVFFSLFLPRDGEGAGSAVLSDGNAQLVDAFLAVRDEVDGVVAALGEFARGYGERPVAERADYYYGVRASELAGVVERAARLIFLNKTCYNGLYRVNREGRFNVPHGRYREPRILDEPGLREASAALAGAQIEALDFEEACARAEPGDFVYLDPPYQPLSATSNFTSYTSADFGPDDQLRLRDVFDDLTARGVAALLSNSDHPDIRELYAAYAIQTVPMGRAINSKGKGRASIDELLISN